MAPCCSQDFCCCKEGNLAKVWHKCIICKLKVHSSLCAHVEEVDCGAPSLTCFMCQNPDESNAIVEEPDMPTNTSEDTVFNNDDEIDLFATPNDKKHPSNCESFIDMYDNDKEMQRIFAMAIGMEEAAELINFNEEPFKSSKQKKSKYKPTNSILFEEIGRRASLKGMATPRYGNKKEMEIKKWLVDNPVFENDDIQYVCQKINAFHQLLHTETQVTMTAVRTAWIGDKPYLRLYHAILSDNDMKDGFVNHHKMLSHLELDGHNNSEKCSLSFYELLADRYNNSMFALHSISISHMHSNFKYSIFVP